MPYEDYYNGGGPPPKPPKPPAPPTPGPEAPPPTAAEQAGYMGETKESGSDPTRGEKHWDPQWEKRMRKLLGSETVGGLGDLYDPAHRQRINRMARDAKKKRKAKAATAPTEAAAPEEEMVAPTPGGEEGGLPTAQGSAGQLEGKFIGDQLAGMFPERSVPGGDLGDQPIPGVGEEQERLQGGADEDQRRQDEIPQSAEFPAGQAGLVGPEDQALAGEQAGSLAPGGAGTAQTGEQYLTGAGIAPPEYPKPKVASGYAQPTTPWPPPPVQPTYYTGGM